MAFADQNTYFGVGDGSILGRFNERDTGNLFEFSKNPAHGVFANPQGTDEFPHLVWVSDNPVNGWPYRYARVLKTRAHVVVDEDEFGNPVVETWHFKQNSHNLYKNG
jgi:hypothetical protein